MEIERAGFCIQEPLAGRVEFLKDVFHEPVFLVHAHLPVVLPAALVGDLVVRALAGDEIMHTAPMRGMQRMDEAAGRVLPARRALRTERIRRRAVENALLGVEVRIARQGLAFAIHEKLVGGKARRNLGLHDAVLVGFPLEVAHLDTAADDRLLFLIGLIDHRRVLGAGIRGGEDQGFGQIVYSLPNEDGHRLAARHLACGLLRPLQGGKGFLQRAGVRVISVGRHIKLRAPRSGRSQCDQRHDHGHYD